MKDFRITIFLGDVHDYLGHIAKRHDPSAYLLDKSNYQRFLDEQPSGDQTIYTSLGDLPKNHMTVYDILCQADVVFYQPPIKWSDGKEFNVVDPNSSLQGSTEMLLSLLPETIKIHGFNASMSGIKDPIPLVDSRKTNDQQMWIAGCSISHGIGVAPGARYGDLLSTDLDMPCSFLTRPGSAIDWASDQIVRSDIRPGDLVIWGLTGWTRMTYVHDHHLLRGLNITSYDVHPEYHDIISIDNLLSEQTFYTHFYAIKRANNFCEKIGATLLLIGLLQDNYNLLGFLKSQKNYIHVPYHLEYNGSTLIQVFEDLGEDDMHPGPRQHQIYKSLILNHIKSHDITQANQAVLG